MADAAEPLVDAVIEDPRWEAAGLGPLAERTARTGLLAVGLDPDAHEIGLLGCDDARIAVLNADFRGKPVPTNVLSWPAFSGPVPEPDGEERIFLGDIAIAWETCLREAEAAGLGLADHATHLVLHGVLHLLGHDHEAAAEADAMEDLEAKILASMGIANPYSA